MKYAMRQTVYYMHRDQITKGQITSRIAVEHNDDEMADLEMIANFSQLFMSKHGTTTNDSGNYYTVENTVFPESMVAASREELAQRLVDAL